MARSKPTRSSGAAAPAGRPPEVSVCSSVLQHIRRHARSTPDTEVCGVLLGRSTGGRTEVVAAVEGREADQGEAHVTFTQETWNTIHREREARYPDQSIVGWYHSHPGFGVFLSDHDLFIHRNFFSDAGQLAWVYDPHADEEACFGWTDGGVRKLRSLEVVAADTTEPATRREPSPAERRALLTAPRGGDSWSWRELGHDLWMMACGVIIGVALTLFLVPLLFRPVVITERPRRPSSTVIRPGQPQRAAPTPVRGSARPPAASRSDESGGRHGQP